MCCGIQETPVVQNFKKIALFLLFMNFAFLQLKNSLFFDRGVFKMYSISYHVFLSQRIKQMSVFILTKSIWAGEFYTYIATFR